MSDPGNEQRPVSGFRLIDGDPPGEYTVTLNDDDTINADVDSADFGTWEPICRNE